MTFERIADFLYTCPVCGGTFRKGNISCCVAHAPGTCCHYGDTPALPGKPKSTINRSPDYSI
jgi:hydrogenase maturation factor